MRNTRSAILLGAAASSERQLVSAIVQTVATPHAVLARIWLTEPNGHLDLAASAGSPTGGGTYNRVDGQFGRVARGAGKIGQIAAERAPLVVRSIRGDEEWLSNPTWIARQGVRAFVGLPIMARDEILGVLGIFDRIAPSDSEIDELRFLADYTAARLVEIRSRALEGDSPLLTRARLRELEKTAIEAALARSRGKIFGHDGAAALLAMKPTTLASRIKALGVRVR